MALTPTLCVVHENKEWLEPIESAFKNRGWNVKEFYMVHPYAIPITNLPTNNCVYFNQMSASSTFRGHSISIPLISNLIAGLEINNIPVINGTNSLFFEVSKWRQYNALDKCNISRPKTEVFTWPLDQHPTIKLKHVDVTKPFILKHNCSGKGLGVKKFEDFHEFQGFLWNNEEINNYPVPSDGIILFQEYIESEKPQILRMEFIGREFVYALYSNTSYGFQLCPADTCQVGDGDENKDKVDKQKLFTLLPKQEIDKDMKLKELMEKYKLFMQENNIDVAAFESILCKQTGQWITYDVNPTTHYSPAIKEQSGISAMDILVDYAETLLKTSKNLQAKL